MDKPKLTERQWEVLERMESGAWELGKGKGITVRYWLQKGGIGYGGESIDLRAPTVHALLNQKLLECHNDGFVIASFRLSLPGRAALAARRAEREGSTA